MCMQLKEAGNRWSMRSWTKTRRTNSSLRANWCIKVKWVDPLHASLFCLLLAVTFLSPYTLHLLSLSLVIILPLSLFYMICFFFFLLFYPGYLHWSGYAGAARKTYENNTGGFKAGEGEGVVQKERRYSRGSLSLIENKKRNKARNIGL